MEGLSAAANGLAVVSVAFQLTEACVKLYRFWESVEDAPIEIAAIKEDLRYLISVFKRVESNNIPSGDCIAEGIKHCRVKIADLMSIVERFDDGFQSLSRRIRVRTAFKAALHSKHVQRFRDSLNDTKSTLTLAMVHESVVQARASSSSTRINVFEDVQQHAITNTPRKSPLLLPGVEDASIWTPVQSAPLKKYDEKCTKPVQDIGVGKFDATFEPTSMDIFAQDGYIIDDCGQLRSKTFVYAENLRYRVHHQTSSFRTAFGCAWVRTTTIYLGSDPESTPAKSQTVTSLVFYPTTWLQYLGVKTGLEAVVASAGRSWLFNCRLTVTRAVPEDSLVFELCQTGQTRAVEALLEKGMGSVVDTSPKGWKPLHFAAAAGHVDLCAMLIRAGADKSALVYEGPTESILSPISLFVACCTDEHADTKIAMLRLFCDCIDIAGPDSDGWNVHDWLKRAYAKERVPISHNSITWLLHLTANEEYVEFSARNIWSALQHAVRSTLNHERHSRYMERILDLSHAEHHNISQRHVDALGFWLALRVSGRVVLPMVVNAGSFLQMKGFDWMEDNLTHKQFMQALPSIYAAWCHALLDCIEKVEVYMREELNSCMQELGWTRDTFVNALSQSGIASNRTSHTNTSQTTCTSCNDDYGLLACALVEPARIAITECVKTAHNSDCVCHSICKADAVLTSPIDLPSYAGTCADYYEEGSLDTDEEFFDAQPHLFNNPAAACQSSSSMFSDIATLLYSAQGRIWMGKHAIGERLCASCFLLREKYIGEDGLAVDFPPMPTSFEGLRVKW
ncbi:hypothetical protein EKO04_001240 [Ascochyta lentis]|uniref:Fungal N-terminal domain-containing protein n=1 Tax=Ascochyta lentis TaxID=205686 RepID=A0A8H7MMB8_9PLEO|nr:hypothetical protein EKO04_001240 [Ascochyta lentis]